MILKGSNGQPSGSSPKPGPRARRRSGTPDSASPAQPWSGWRKKAARAKRTPYQKALDQAVVRDCVVKISWTGKADLDLLVEDPSGTVCSFRNPRTTGGGILMGDTSSGLTEKNGRRLLRRLCLPPGV